MESLLSLCCQCPIIEGQFLCRLNQWHTPAYPRFLDSRVYYKKVPKNLSNRRRTELPPDFGVNTFLKKKKSSNVSDPDSYEDLVQVDTPDSSQGSFVGDDYTHSKVDGNVDASAIEEVGEKQQDGDCHIAWDPDEIEAISSLFRGRIPQKPGKSPRRRPLPLPLPYKVRPLGLPSLKKHERTAHSAAVSSRQQSFGQMYKDPSFLIGVAREIRSLPAEKDVSTILNKCARFLRKGSLSLTIRELGHMGLPGRALEVFCWVQEQPELFPDDGILASTVQVLARAHELKMPFNVEKFISLSSRGVYEAMIRGFIKGGSLKIAWKLLSAAKDSKRSLDVSIYAKLILELGKNPDKHMFVFALLEEIGQREDLNLTQQDCTAIMKICIRLRKFEIVESLFSWFKNSGHQPSVVMYTTLIHSRYSEKKYREALALVWEMEASQCLFDLPAYRTVIKLFVALDDLSRAVRYYSKLKEAGFSPTFDIYRNLIKIYMASGRLAKCKEVCMEAEMAGFKLDQQTRSELSVLSQP